MTAFYVCGGVLALWAVLLSAMGIMREGFPGSKGSERLVGAISVVLTAAAILSGVIGAALHEQHEDEGHETEAASLPAR
ncbi:MAG TPA: hypothetical protein VEX39_13345 [Thermoleophilaceae bacterium]|nr:hypothetical protein [Thermoleophilaceae bacterium]